MEIKDIQQIFPTKEILNSCSIFSLLLWAMGEDVVVNLNCASQCGPNPVHGIAFSLQSFQKKRRENFAMR